MVPEFWYAIDGCIFVYTMSLDRVRTTYMNGRAEREREKCQEEEETVRDLFHSFSIFSLFSFLFSLYSVYCRREYVGEMRNFLPGLVQYFVVRTVEIFHSEICK